MTSVTEHVIIYVCGLLEEYVWPSKPKDAGSMPVARSKLMSYFDDNEARITGLNLGNRWADGWFPSLPKQESRLMQIQILNVNKIPATTSKGEAYTALEVAFKNITFQGKVEGKKLTPYGTGKAAYTSLANAQPGQFYDITIVKENGYNNWSAATLGNGEAAQSQAPTATAPTGGAYRPQGTSTARSTERASTFETPEERAKKQVYIVRQSSISSAIAALSVGSKAPLKGTDVVDYAKFLESYVFGTGEPQEFAKDSGFDDMQDDVPL